MAAHAGSKVSRNGLVFQFNMDNTEKSWKGPPVTNLITTNSEPTSTTSVTASGGGGTLTYDTENQAIKWVRTSYATWGAYNNWGPIFNGTLDTSKQYTISFEWKIENTSAIPASQYSYNLVQGNGQSAAAGANLLSNSTLQDNGWYLFSYTFTPNNTGVSAYNRVIMGNKNTDVSTFYWRKIQFEQSPFRTPYVSGARTGTSSIVDLSGQGNTITPVNLTYNSDGTFQFDGTDDYIDLPNSMGYTTRVSAFSWFKQAGTPAGNYHIVCGGQELEISIHTDGYLRTGVQTSNGRFVSNHGTGLVDGNWHYVGFTYNGTTKTAYIDGEAVGTYAVTGNLSNSFANRRIGRFGSNASYYLNGFVSSFKIFDKALTAKEVKKNYIAYRKRYE